MGKTKKKKAKVKCSFCDKIHSVTPVFKGQGSHVGNSRTLARRLMKLYGKPARLHPLSTGGGKNKCAEAHHLICSESMNNDEWAEICKNFGYDINCKENGTMLPSVMRVACEARVPLHNENHDNTIGLPNKNYVASVKKKISNIAKRAKNKNFCDTKEDIIAELNNKSKEIWGLVKNFTWTITPDGRHYHPSSKTGCMGLRRFKDKKDNDTKGMTCSRVHNTRAGVFWRAWEEPVAQ